MARTRLLKPGFFENERLAEIGPLGHLLFAGLWGLADRAGRMEDRPLRIKAKSLPYYEADADALLDALADRGFVVRYECGGTRYLQIVNFDKHQTPHKQETASAIPPPEGHRASTEQAPDMSGANSDQGPNMSGASTDQGPDGIGLVACNSLLELELELEPELELGTTGPSDSETTGGVQRGTDGPAADAAHPEPAPEEQAIRSENDDEYPPPVPSDPPKPRTDKQVVNDRRHERRDALFRAWCRGIGLDPDSAEADVGKPIAANHLKAVVDKPAPTPEDFERCTRYLTAEPWRDEPPKVTHVVAGYAGWVARGRPETPTERAPPGTGRTWGGSRSDQARQELEALQAIGRGEA